MRRDDESYYRGRAIEERTAAQNATSGAARKVHDQLATMYRFRAAMLSYSPSEWSGFLQDEEIAETV
jgi:hypothetical protein